MEQLNKLKSINAKRDPIGRQIYERVKTYFEGLKMSKVYTNKLRELNEIEH